MKRKVHLVLVAGGVIGAALLSYIFLSSQNAAPLFVLEVEGVPVSYSEITDLEDGGQMQLAFLGDPEDPGADALGISAYPNPDRLSAEEWVRREWDPQGLLVLEHLELRAGKAVLIKDANAWADRQAYLVEFNTLIILSTRDRIITFDRLSGLETSPEQILEMLEKVRGP